MKITKKNLKKIIEEEININLGMPGKGAPAYMAPNQGMYLKNYPGGEGPDNSDRPQMARREPYETLGVEVDIEDGDALIVIGKNQYKLIFDNEDLTSGKVVPMGEYKFTIDAGTVNWFDNAPAHVRFDSHLEKQIKDFSGREE